MVLRAKSTSVWRSFGGPYPCFIGDSAFYNVFPYHITPMPFVQTGLTQKDRQHRQVDQQPEARQPQNRETLDVRSENFRAFVAGEDFKQENEQEAAVQTGQRQQVDQRNAQRQGR